MPEAMKNVPEVGFVYNINMESLIGLKPDLVIANKNQHEKFLPLLESNKIPVIAINPKTYDEVKDKLILMGKIYGVPEKGEAAAAKLDQQVKAVTEKLPKDATIQKRSRELMQRRTVQNWQPTAQPVSHWMYG